MKNFDPFTEYLVERINFQVAVCKDQKKSNKAGLMTRILKKLGAIAVITIVFFCQMEAQEYQSGLLFEDEVYDTLPRQNSTAGSKNALPPMMSLKAYCPTIRNQGDIFSCVGWSVGYAAMTIERAVGYNCTDQKIIDYNAHSALYVFNNISGGVCDKGSRISDAIQFLMEGGNCYAREFDFDINDCQKEASDSLREKAEKYAIDDFQTLFHIEADPKFKVWKVRQALAHRKPVVIGMKVRKNFYQLKDARFWWPDKGNTTPAGGHAMTVIGYDDYKGAFQLFNSWGKSWGENGYIWVKYADFGRFCKYAYILHLSKEQRRIQQNQSIWVENNIAKTNDRNKPANEGQNVLSAQQIEDEPAKPVLVDQQESAESNETATIPPVQTNTHPAPIAASEPIIEARPLRQLSGSFSFEEFAGFNGTEPRFRKAEVSLKNQSYQLKRTDWQPGTRFQLAINNAMTEQYLYVFSIDATEKWEIHFPKKGALNNKYKGMNESALILFEESDLLIPGKDNGQHRVLKLTQKGTDHLCVLFSTKRIPNHFLKALAKRTKGHKADFMAQLKFLLGKKLVPLADVNYAHNEIGFEVNTRSEGMIVPLILEVVSE